MLVERDGPLKSLAIAAQLAWNGKGSTVVVSGEAGIGKTSLLKAFASQDMQQRVLWGGCEALFTARPLGPLYDIAAAIDPAIFKLLSSGTRQEVLFPSVLHSIQSRRVSLVIVFEDIQWADTATLDLIKYMGRRAPQLRLLMVLSQRSDEIGPDHPVSQVIGDLPHHALTRLDLAPLSREAVRLMAETLGLSGDAVFDITGGNPFYVSELLANGSDQPDVIPSSIRDAVWSRIARLDVEERTALDAMSLVPGSVELWLVREVLGLTSDDVVDRCVSRGLGVFDDAGNFQFRHELARLATLARVSTVKQRQLNADLLAIMKVAKRPFSLSRLVHHAAAADDRDTVLSLAPQAAAEAAQLGAHQQAAAHLATALQFSDGADDCTIAQLSEDWAYEAGIAVGINDEIIAARNRAIALWQKLERPDKVALNYRWLSRLHWYRGETDLAADYINDAIAALDGLEPDVELAWTFSARSQMHMLHDRMEEAIRWGEKAMALAKRLHATEVLTHALNNVASARLFSGRGGGEELMKQSLALALEHGFHEQAARAYTNFSEYAVTFRKFALAERILSEGIAFDTKHDLDSWTHYLLGRKAQLRMDQGLFKEAETMTQSVLQKDRLTLVMKLPARLVLGRTVSRLGKPDAAELLQEALTDALATNEAQYVSLARLGILEHAWIASQASVCEENINAILEFDTASFDPWELGEVAVWMTRCRIELSRLPSDMTIAPPFQAEIAGHILAAADQWEELGLPFAAGLALLQADKKEAGPALMRAVSIFDRIGAKPAAELARLRANELGVSRQLPKRRRGPYAAARKHPYGLTTRENQMLAMVADGLSNHEISELISRSERTVEHHVSSVLAKLGAVNRIDLMLRLRSEPWLLSHPESARDGTPAQI